MNIVEKARYARLHTDHIPNYLRSNLLMSTRYLRESRPHYFVASMIGGITGFNPIVAYYRRRSVDGTVVLENIHGNRMCVSLDDAGLSRDLLMYRTREEKSTEVFRRELARVRRRDDSPIVLELGANLGYYALQEADLLGEDANIYAFEPEPRNFSLLTQNIALNGYEDRFTTENKAAGLARGQAELLVSAESNKHQISDHVEGETTTVEIVPVSEYFDDLDIQPDEVSVVRMDVQGYEGKILRNIHEILTAESPLLMFVEFHQGIAEEDLDELVPIFEERFDIVSSFSSRGAQSWYEYPFHLDGFEDLRQLTKSVELIMTRR